jgi:hypothetical protein
MDEDKLRRVIGGLSGEAKEALLELVHSLQFETEALERSRERFETEAKQIIERLRAEEREVKATRNFLALMSGNNEEEK